MSKSIGIIVAIIIFINFIVGAAAKSKKGNPSNKTNQKAKPAPTFSRIKKNPRDSTPKVRRVSVIEKEYMRDNDFSGTYSQDGNSFIPNPEMEDPQDSKAFYIIIVGLIVLAAVAFFLYSLL